MTIKPADLQAYLDEALPADRMAVIEQALRDDDDLRQQLAGILTRRDAGVHSVGEIWRRQRLSCPSREEIGSYLLGVLDDGHAGYIKFHLETIGCRLCEANREDLQRQQAESAETASSRRNKIFHSTAGQLKTQRKKS
jgi:hypothetical protein